jgi:hypothetical protein
LIEESEFVSVQETLTTKEKAMTEVKEAPKTTPSGPAQAKEAVQRSVAKVPAGELRPYNLVRSFAREIDRAFEDFGIATGFSAVATSSCVGKPGLCRPTGRPESTCFSAKANSLCVPICLA